MKYRKKPIVIEAEQFNGDYVRGLCQHPGCVHAGIARPHVHTAHNNQIVFVVEGDFIIPEPDGEHYYPCKADIFEDTYDRVKE
jgi:hypothetical protein